MGKLEGLVHSWLPARDIVAAALDAAPSVHPSGEVILLETTCPWKAHLMELEEERGIAGSVKYALFTDRSGAWRIQAVPISPDSFQSRLPLPEPWRGVRDAELDAKAELGVDGAIFVHASGFIGGHKTYEGVVAMANKALALAGEA